MFSGSRFFGGMEFAAVADGAPAEAASIACVAELVRRGTFAVPSFTMTSGPVPDSAGKGFVNAVSASTAPCTNPTAGPAFSLAAAPPASQRSRCDAGSDQQLLRSARALFGAACRRRRPSAAKCSR